MANNYKKYLPKTLLNKYLELYITEVYETFATTGNFCDISTALSLEDLTDTEKAMVSIYIQITLKRKGWEKLISFQYVGFRPFNPLKERFKYQIFKLNYFNPK